MAEEPIALGYYAAVLRRHSGLIVGIALFTGLAAAVALGTARYEASAEVLVRPMNSASSPEIQSERNLSMNTERRYASSVEVASIVAERLGEDNPRRLLRNLTVTVPLETQTLVIDYSASTAVDAQAGAQGFAEAYLEFRARSASGDRADRIAQLEADLEARSTDLRAVRLVVNAADDGNELNDPSPEDLAAAQSRQEILTDEVGVINENLGEWRDLTIDPGEVIAEATEPNAPSQRSRLILFILGTGVGGVLGAALAFVIDRLRARVNTAEDLADELDAPVLATIPAVARASQVLVTLTEPHSAAAHAYRRLAVALTADPDRELRWVLLVGATRQEPRTAVALNLAVALLQQGRSVLLVSGDRHDPQIDRCFGLAGQPGLDEHLAGRATSEPQEVLHGLHVLPAGTGEHFPVHHMPPQQAIAAVLERGRRIADIVIVDAPPALDYSDAEAIGPLVDAVIVVASAETTSRREVAEIRSRLDLVLAPVRGAVLVHRPTLRHHLAVRLRERAEDRRAMAAAAAAAMPEEGGRSPSGWADDLVAVSNRSAEDLAEDAAALKARIEALLRRHTPTGISTRLPGATPPRDPGFSVEPVVRVGETSDHPADR